MRSKLFFGFYSLQFYKYNSVHKARFKKNKNKIVEFSTKGGGVRMGRFSTKKKKKNAKMIRMVQFIQKTQDVNFLFLGGSGQIFGLIVRFYFISMVISFKIWQIILFSSKIMHWILIVIDSFTFICNCSTSNLFFGITA